MESSSNKMLKVIIGIHQSSTWGVIDCDLEIHYKTVHTQYNLRCKQSYKENKRIKYFSAKSSTQGTRKHSPNKAVASHVIEIVATTRRLYISGYKHN